MFILLKCFCVAAAQVDTTKGAAMALPEAGHAAMTAPIASQEAVVAVATQGKALPSFLSTKRRVATADYSTLHWADPDY